MEAGISFAFIVYKFYHYSRGRPELFETFNYVFDKNLTYLLPPHEAHILHELIGFEAILFQH